MLCDVLERPREVASSGLGVLSAWARPVWGRRLLCLPGLRGCWDTCTLSSVSVPASVSRGEHTRAEFWAMKQGRPLMDTLPVRAVTAERRVQHSPRVERLPAPSRR